MTNPRIPNIFLIFTRKANIAIFLFLFLLSACSDQGLQKFEGPTQGTTYHISYWTETGANAKEVKDSVEQELAVIDKLLSNYRPDSTIEGFNRNESTESLEVGSEIVSLVRVAKTVHQASHGCYDLTIKPLFDLWGFQGDMPTIPDDAAIQATMKQIGMDKLEIVDDTHLRKTQTDLELDMSSIAQGYSVERVSRVLERKGIENYLVEIGGELKTKGHKPDQQVWRIALERPMPEERVMHKVVTMPKDTPMAVMTSGTYRHYFDDHGRRYSHVLDARNGRPINHDLVSVTVLYPDPVVADAWSTALLCLGQQDAMQAANIAKIPVFFIELKNDEMVESASDALKELSAISIQ